MEKHEPNGHRRSYTLEEAEALGFTGPYARLRAMGIKPIPKPKLLNDCVGSIEPGDDVTHGLSARIRKRLDTTGGGKHDDRSREDESVICAILDAGHSPQDALTTFMASARGQDVENRKNGHVDDYMQRTIAKAVAYVGKQDTTIEIDFSDTPSRQPSDEWAWNTLRDALSQKIESIPYIVEDLVVEGGLTGVSAHPHALKSASWLLACLEAAAGRNVWAHFQVSGPVRTAFIETEDPEWMVIKRIQEFTNGLHLSKEERVLVEQNFRYKCLGPFNLIDMKDQLASFLQQHQPQFAVLSTLQGLIAGLDWKEQRDMGPVNAAVVHLAHEVCPIVLITHSPWNGKDKRAAGSVTQEANYTISVHFEKQSNPDGSEKIAVSTDSKLGSALKFILLVSTDGKKLLRLSYARIRKREEVEAADPDMSSREVAERLGVSDRYARKLRQKNSSGRRNKK